MPTPWKALLLTLIFPVVLVVGACQSAAPEKKDAQYYFLKGEESFEDHDYEEAIKDLEKVRDSFYSPELTALADLKIADSYYYDEKYVEAAAAYEDFLKQHPAHPQTARVIYQLGMSYFQQRLSPDRDQMVRTGGVFASLAFVLGPPSAEVGGSPDWALARRDFAFLGASAIRQ